MSEMEDWEEQSIENETAALQDVEHVKAAKLIAVEEASSVASAIRSHEGDIVKRARKLFSAGFIQYPDVKSVRKNDMFVNQPVMTDENKVTVLNALFEGIDEAIPHRDHFRGRIVDHEGRIIDDHYPVVRWIQAFSAAGLKGVSAKAARDVVKEWALDQERNDLINYVENRIPEWDETPRMDTALIDLFQTFDTPLNRDFGKYFWLSLYSRIMMPGSLAPMVLSLFGTQDCGKSYFGKLICRVLTGNAEADTVQLNLDGEKLEFLREITGQSVVASVGEMTGFTRGDLNKIKDFITRTSDKMHYKFEGTFDQQRQFIIMMDGNKYEGLQRDDTGNRRLYPMFCGQLPDYLGQPAWRADFAADFTSFEPRLWQLMAEAAAWFDEHGEEGYNLFVRSVVKQVFEFSKNEMAGDRGTIRDDIMDVYLVPMLKECEKVLWKRHSSPPCVGVKTGVLKRHFMDTLRHVKPNWKHLKNKMLALGAVEHAFTGGYAGYLFPKFETLEAFVAGIGELAFDDGGSVDAVITAKTKDEGF
jgi:hypothetical protein